MPVSETAVAVAPPDARRLGRVEWILFLVALGGVVVLPFWGTIGRVFTPDAFGYALLGEHLWSTGEYSSPSIRDFLGILRVPQPSRSFPPLWPVVVGFAQLVTRAGIFAGVVANLVVFALSLAVLARLCGALGAVVREPIWLLPGFVAFVLLDLAYSDELVTAKSMGFLVCLYLVLLLLVARTELSGSPAHRDRYLFGTGVCLGLLALTRFDQTVFVAGLVAGIALVRGRRAGLLVVAGCGLALLPWVVRNLVVFHQPWVSDNAVTAASLYPREMGFSWFAPGREPGTWRTDPGLWLEQRWGYLRGNLYTWGLLTNWLPMLAVPLAVWRWKHSPPVVRWLLAVLGWHLVSVLGVVSLTPYRLARYFTTAHLETWLALALVLAQLPLPRRLFTPAVRWGLLVAFTAMVLGMPGAGDRARWSTVDLPIHRLSLVVRNALPATRPVLVAADDAEGLAWFTRRPTIYMPINATKDPAGFEDWMRRFSPTHLVLSEADAGTLGLLTRPVLARHEALLLIETGVAAPTWVTEGR